MDLAGFPWPRQAVHQDLASQWASCDLEWSQPNAERPTQSDLDLIFSADVVLYAGTERRVKKGIAASLGGQVVVDVDTFSSPSREPPPDLGANVMVAVFPCPGFQRHRSTP